MDALNVIAFIVGVWLLIKKLADMDRYHTLRVVVLTSILSCLVLYLFVVYGCTQINSGMGGDCIVSFDDRNQF
jgi:hypothetical protein